ncbi:MAG: hypothetical protein WC566_01115 [Dehalococcoidia bacterium]
MRDAKEKLLHPDPRAVVTKIDQRMGGALAALELVNRKKAGRRIVSAKTLGRLNT